MRISALNILTGTAMEVTTGATTAHVRLDVDGTTVTAAMTHEAVDELGLAAGDEA
jgi:molybdopterin-binding protein